MEEVKVSVVCNTFNHARYIRDALDGFVMQKTNFRFEILIHDDASVDGTQEIIREYVSKYPDLIRPIYQTVNQYSKGVSITRDIQVPRAKGKYIAFCEGDDYWTSPLKLQQQFDQMEKHENVSMCAHAATMINAKDGKTIKNMSPSGENRILKAKEVIAGGGAFVSTNTLFFRRDLFFENAPFRAVYPIDYSLQIQGSLKSGILYLKDNMAIYRFAGPNSWTESVLKNKEKRKLNNMRVKAMLRQLDKDTNGRFHWTIEKTIFINAVKDFIKSLV